MNKVTVRSLESLFRLSEAHARLMYRNEVTLEVSGWILCILLTKLVSFRMLLLLFTLVIYHKFN